jgi:peptidoglycan/xylan/chitin deacetylase (PgdA/CDA1 family)
VSSWLDPLRAALDETPATFFFRNDDVGWHDDRLRRLLEVFERHAAPIDLAVIPRALDPQLARELSARGTAIGLHQHGFAHLNHERDGRKCEFGRSRSAAEQRRDIERGRLLLEQLLEAPLDPIFTPPWNRCTQATGTVLVGAGIRVLSRESGAQELGIRGLEELPVRVDWFAHRKGTRLTPDELGGRLATEVRRGGPVGVMFHHALMDGQERRRVAELLDMLHEGARLARMTELVGVAV